MAKLILYRNNEYTNCLRDYQVYLDGKKISSIANGETKSFDIFEGRHKIKLSIDWCSSPELTYDFKENDVIELRASGFRNAGKLLPLAVLAGVVHLLLKYFYGNDYALLMTIPLLMILIAYLTVLRKRYLVLSEIGGE